MLTVRQAAKRLGVSPGLVRRLCQQRVIPHVPSQMVDQIRIPVAAVEHLDRLCRQDAASLTPADFFSDPTLPPVRAAVPQAIVPPQA